VERLGQWRIKGGKVQLAHSQVLGYRVTSEDFYIFLEKHLFSEIYFLHFGKFKTFSYEIILCAGTTGLICLYGSGYRISLS